jgi:hypothetical protein
MSIDLVVANPISSKLQPVMGQGGGTSSGLSLAANYTLITGVDAAGTSMPLVVSAQPQGSTRILRLQGTSGAFFDFGIDSSGNLYINSTQANGILKLSPNGQLTVANLTLSNLQPAPAGSVDLAADANGAVYTQS